MRAALLFVLIYVAFDRMAALLHSGRGEWGGLICLVVVGLCLVAERLLDGTSPATGVRLLGLRAPRLGALVAGAVIAGLLVASLPALAAWAGARLELRPGAAWLALGMFAQGGVAEETLFRGFMFRHLRRGRSFARAATLSALPFAAVHVPLFWTLDPVVASVALLLALASAWPFARLFEASGGSIWPGAVLHAAIQGVIKLLVDDVDGYQTLSIGWVVLCMVLPWLVFLFPRSRDAGGP